MSYRPHSAAALSSTSHGLTSALHRHSEARTPKDKPPKPLEQVEAASIRSDVRHAANDLEELISQLANAGVAAGLEGGPKEWRRHLRGVDTVAGLQEALVRLEAQISVMYDGLPFGACPTFMPRHGQLGSAAWHCCCDVPPLWHACCVWANLPVP